LNKNNLTSVIKKKSFELGFDLFGVSSPHIDLDNSNILDEWLDNGYHATMHWIEKRKEERKNIFKYFPEVKSVISFGYNYYTGENELDSKKYKISNYSWGEDYHLIIKKKLYQIIDLIQNNKNSDFKYRVCVDTSPILEKNWAQKSGLGWIGKHTNLINDKIGSWFFLAEILVDFELEFNKPFSKDLCGTCTRCIEACPTDAIFEEYKLDANKCISYLTIEHRDDFSNEFDLDLSGWIYGCDICQQVCPWNEKFSINTTDLNFEKRENIQKMSNKDWNNLKEMDFKRIFKKSAIKRTKFSGLKRNIKANNK
tara:strand:- start:1018 stop:1950 length:933 start_codon:yes stop_codon:yes gene_type:complete